jgi:hypothetical protein
MTTDTKAVARWTFGGSEIDLESSESGDYVLFTDHERAVGELQAALAASRAEFEGLQAACSGSLYTLFLDAYYKACETSKSSDWHDAAMLAKHWEQKIDAAMEKGMSDIKIIEAAPNWCRTCGRRPNDPMSALCLDTHHRTMERIHPQPAELAEQQGVELPPLPEAWYRPYSPNAPIGQILFSVEQMQDYARAALAATGRKQVGDIDPRAALGWEKACAVTGLRQVGEVQGDALSLADHITDHLCHHEYDIGGRSELLACVIEALAARQPGAQEPVAECLTGANIMRLPAGRGLPPGTKLYAAPPAQGIDLGQLWEPIKEAVHVALSVHVAAMSQKKREQVAVYVARQLRAGHRDAAPGVGQ